MNEIRFYRDDDRKNWNSYILIHPQGTLFHCIEWKNVIENTFGHRSYYLIAESNSNTATPQQTNTTFFTSNLKQSDPLSSNKDERLQPKTRCSSNLQQGSIVGVLPLFSVKSFLFGRSLISIPFAAYGGVLADGQEVTKQLLEKAKELTRSERLEYLELRNRDEEIAGFPSKDLYVKFRRNIFKDLNENMEAIPRKSRRMIRVGEKEGLRYQFGHKELLPLFYEIFARNYRHLGSPVFSKKLFENLLEAFKEKVGILVIKSKEGKPIASVLSFFYKDEVIPYYAGSLFEYRQLAPNDFMYWQLMKYGCENGYKTFDFGRSKVNTGSYDFKRHWGFEPQPLQYQYFLNRIKEIPNVSPVNPKYQRKIEIWKRLPFWLTKVIGPRIVKYIP
jgi:FemAB-related protein (PEP-CTERM system-associated)